MLIDPNARTAVTDDAGENTIYIKAKMDMATETAVSVEFDRLNQRTVRRLQKTYELALLTFNVVAWEGPAFMRKVSNEETGEESLKLVACTPTTIGQLDPDEPLVRKVLEAIDLANAKKSADDDDGSDVGMPTKNGKRPRRRSLKKK